MKLDLPRGRHCDISSSVLALLGPYKLSFSHSLLAIGAMIAHVIPTSSGSSRNFGRSRSCHFLSASFSFLALLGLVVGPWSGTASADAELKLAGFADVPGAGGTLFLPLPAGAAPVTIDVTFGIPSVTIPVEIAPSTHVESEAGLPVLAMDRRAERADLGAGAGRRWDDRCRR